MRALLFVLTVLFIFAPSHAQAEDQVLRYQLLLDGDVVGHREVEIRYLPPAAGEIDEARMIRSYLEMSVTKGAQVYTLKSRASSMHGPGGASISTSVEENGKGREVQARVELDGSWTVHELENGMRSTWSFTRKEVGLSTMDLVDPERYRRILDHEMNPMLIAETGQVAIGRIQDLGEAQVEVAGKMMTVQKISWTPEAGQLLLLFSESGLLVDYSLDFMGKRLHAKLEALPEERSWGGFEPAVFGGVSEEEL